MSMCMYHPAFSGPQASDEERLTALLLKIVDLEDQLARAGQPVAGFLEGFEPLDPRYRGSAQGELAERVRAQKPALLGHARSLNNRPGISVSELEVEGLAIIRRFLAGELKSNEPSPPRQGCCCAHG